MPSDNKCVTCGREIKAMVFHGTGVCCDLCRKKRDGDDKSAYPTRSSEVPPMMVDDSIIGKECA